MMQGRRNRLAVKPDYYSALGHVTYAFSALEWQVVWCCEKIKPGSLRKITGNEMTAGVIAKEFINVCRNMPQSNKREELKGLAGEFSDLVEVRNRIIHGKPCTGPNGDARLSSSGIIEIEDLEDAADSFAESSGKLNALFYSFLQSYAPSINWNTRA